jgi:hypothetical protein
MDDWEGRNGRNTVGACYDTHAVLREYKSFFEKALYLAGCETGISRGRLTIPIQLILSHHSSFILSDGRSPVLGNLSGLRSATLMSNGGFLELTPCSTG